MLNVSVLPVDEVFCEAALVDELFVEAALVDELFVEVAVVLEAAGSLVAFSSADIGDLSSSIVEVTFSAAIFSPSSDYDLGVTITVNGTPATISSAVLQSGSISVRYTLAAAVDADDVIAFAYSQAVGDLRDGSGVDVADIAATPVTNQVGSHWYFDEAADAVHIVEL